MWKFVSRENALVLNASRTASKNNRGFVFIDVGSQVHFVTGL